MHSGRGADVSMTDITPDSPVDAAAEPTFTRVKTLAAYAELVSAKASGPDRVWFRGTSSADAYPLSPSLYRRKSDGSDDFYARHEASLIETFRHRSPPFMTTPLPPEDDQGNLHTLFIMQHYGIPTRLLDWSENPFVALYFALVKWRKSLPSADAGVWLLDPRKLNRSSLQGTTSDSDIILPPSHPNLRGYQPGQIARKKPVAMYGVHNSKRIVAQRGVFVLFGSDPDPMDQQEPTGDDKVLDKIIIDKDCAGEIFSALFNMGFTDSVVFPDLDGLAKEVSYQHGY